jgi:hypothetical protein
LMKTMQKTLNIPGSSKKGKKWCANKFKISTTGSGTNTRLRSKASHSNTWSTTSLTTPK